MILQVLNIIKDFRRKKNNRHYLKMGKSVDQGIVICQQVPRKIQPSVIIGDNSVVSGTFVFESSHGCINIGNSTFVGGVILCV